MNIIIMICKLLLGMAVGLALAKKQIIDEETRVKISFLVTNVTNPCLILYSVSTVSGGDRALVFKLFLMGLFMYLVVFFILGKVFAAILRVPKHLKGTYSCMLMFANCSFMGYPVAQAFFGDSAIFYAAIFNMAFNPLVYSLGLQLFRKDAAVESGEEQSGKVDFRSLINMGTVFSVAALVIFFAELPIPSGFFEVVNFIGSLTPALSMIVIGASLAGISLSELKSEKRVWLLLPIRLGLMPVIVWLGMHLITDDPLIIGACTVTIGMPVAAMVGMGSAPYPTQHKSASIGVAVTTICSMVTIPIMGILLGAG